MAKIALGLAKRAVDSLLPLAQNIISSMTGNANYTTPIPPLADVTAKRTGLLNKHAEVLALSTQLGSAQVEMRMLMDELGQMLSDLGGYAESVTSGDRAKLESGGFPIARVPQPIGPLPAPASLASSTGVMEGTALCRWKAVRGAKSYVAECASAPAGPWTEFYTGTKPRCTAAGLTSGQIYFFRVAAVGAAGQGPWSDISEKRAA